MNRTSIEWVRNPDGSQGYTHNPLSGCKNHTPEGLCLDGLFPCYAWKLAHTRLKQRYLANRNVSQWDTDDNILKLQMYNDPFYPRFWEKRLSEGIFNLGIKPKGIFVCDMGDLFGIGVPEDWTKKILAVCKMSCYQQHRFYLLTKQPQNLIKFSPFPDNCWVGVTITNDWDGRTYPQALACLSQVEAGIKYISFEPLLGRIVFNMPNLLKQSGINWLIIGACTGSYSEMSRLVGRLYPDMKEQCYVCSMRIQKFGSRYTLQPKIEWVREIVEAADKAGVKVFLKDNLKPLLLSEGLQDNRFWRDMRDSRGLEPLHTELRQEMPERN